MSTFDKSVPPIVVGRYSYMNDSKWRAVRRVVVAGRIPCRMKLTYIEYAGDARPGAAVIRGYFYDGSPRHVEAQTVWAATPKYWDCVGVGPFVSREIDWLAVATPAFAAVRHELPANLAVVESGGESVMLGYGPPFDLGPVHQTDPRS